MTSARVSAKITRAPGWVRRNRLGLLIGSVVLGSALATAVFGGGGDSPTADLDPDNPGRNGARALAQVLDDEGVDVTVARGAEALEDLRVSGDTTVVVTSSGDLAESTADRLLAHVAGQRLVIVEPPPAVVAALGYPTSPYPIRTDGPRHADCDVPLLDGLTIEVDSGVAYSGGTVSCFGGDRGAMYVDVGGGTTLLGAGSILANDQITRADNAAAAMRILGQERKLVWYVPDVADQTATDSVSLRSLLPDWTLPGLALCLVALIVMMFWRGRRLGPLVTEPLPVNVKAIETTHSRGRLYRKVNDRPHAAVVLRGAARGRLARRLRLPRSTAAEVDLLVREVARHTGRPLEDVRALISRDGPQPHDDRDLIRLARDLAELDREVVHRP